MDARTVGAVVGTSAMATSTGAEVEAAGVKVGVELGVGVEASGMGIEVVGGGTRAGVGVEAWALGAPWQALTHGQVHE
ncbi:unnamed protein product [Ilex paraguariensis]|uniref:Uncharacterized protein n=1 Tax=Ilex paraguariensis TaxID=185542 RepID=A0ABC8RXP5_9AQUA